MDSGFVKIYGTILRSSIWLESPTTRILWITMLAMADRNGEVAASAKGLAHVANITPAECESGLRTLLDPDLDSRTPDNEGRRIEVIEGGWRILNYTRYRELRTTEQVQAALRKAAQRERDKSQDTRDNHAGHVEKLEVKRLEEDNCLTALTTSDGFDLFWSRYPRRAGGNPKRAARRAWDARLRAGADVTAILSGTDRYHAFCVATGKIGTEFVKRASSFLGPDEHYLESWDLPAPTSGSKQDRGRAGLMRALQQGDTNGKPTTLGEISGDFPRALPNPRSQ